MEYINEIEKRKESFKVFIFTWRFYVFASILLHLMGLYDW